MVPSVRQNHIDRDSEATLQKVRSPAFVVSHF